MVEVSAVPSPRQFPPPWTFEDNGGACFIMKDAHGNPWLTSISIMSPAGARPPIC